MSIETFIWLLVDWTKSNVLPSATFSNFETKETNEERKKKTPTKQNPQMNRMLSQPNIILFHHWHIAPFFRLQPRLETHIGVVVPLGRWLSSISLWYAFIDRPKNRQSNTLTGLAHSIKCSLIRTMTHLTPATTTLVLHPVFVRWRSAPLSFTLIPKCVYGARCKWAGFS